VSKLKKIATTIAAATIFAANCPISTAANAASKQQCLGEVFNAFRNVYESLQNDPRIDHTTGSMSMIGSEPNSMTKYGDFILAVAKYASIQPANRSSMPRIVNQLTRLTEMLKNGTINARYREEFKNVIDALLGYLRKNDGQNPEMTVNFGYSEFIAQCLGNDDMKLSELGLALYHLVDFANLPVGQDTFAIMKSLMPLVVKKGLPPGSMCDTAVAFDRLAAYSSGTTALRDGLLRDASLRQQVADYIVKVARSDSNYTDGLFPLLVHKLDFKPVAATLSILLDYESLRPIWNAIKEEFDTARINFDRPCFDLSEIQSPSLSLVVAHGDIFPYILNETFKPLLNAVIKEFSGAPKGGRGPLLQWLAEHRDMLKDLASAPALLATALCAHLTEGNFEAANEYARLF
jgi:hypothetical protein